MTLGFLAYVVAPGIALAIAGIGYAIIAFTEPVAKQDTVSEHLGHHAG